MPKVFISRPLKKNSIFLKTLNGNGLEIIGQSLIHFSPVPFSTIPTTDWLFFYSKNGVKFFFEQVQKSPSFQKDIGGKKWAAMGKGTATAFVKYGINPDFIGDGKPSSTAEQFQAVAANQTVLFIQAKTSKKSIQKLLNKQTTIKELVVYDNQIKSDFELPYFDVLVFTSPLNAQAYFEKYPLQKPQSIIAIGNTTAKALLKLGVKKVSIAAKPTEKEMAKIVLQSIENSVKMSEKYAVIDLGTNTFHLLVAERSSNQSFKEVHRKRFFVKLAEEGIETIGAAPIQRGLQALNTFRATLDEFGIQKVKALGTAALRTATNGPAFVQKVKEDFDIQIELIDGNQEAEFIYKGVVLAVPFKADNFLIMDIGGGSVEFIIANENQVHWAHSFPIGVAVLYKKFHQQEPISPQGIKNIKEYLNSFLSPLYEALIQFPVSTLVGASGTFDVLEFILAKNQSFVNHAFVNAKDFQPLYQLLLKSTKEERFKMKDVPDTRADMIVVAVILIDFILKKTKIEDIIVSSYALKEGVLSNLMDF